MTTKELNNYIKEGILPLTTQLGFSKYESSKQGATFLKINKDSRFLIGYGFLAYDYFRIGTMNAFVCFPELELLVRPILENNGLSGKGALKDYISNSLNYQSSPNYIEGLIDIYSEKDLDSVIEKYKKSIMDDFVQYFEKSSNLNKFYYQLKNESDQTILENQLQSSHYKFKLLAIYRLCNDERYELLMNDYYSGIEKAINQMPDHIELKRYWGAIQDLKKTLDNTAPIYNV